MSLFNNELLVSPTMNELVSVNIKNQIQNNSSICNVTNVNNTISVNTEDKIQNNSSIDIVANINNVISENTENKIQINSSIDNVTNVDDIISENIELSFNDDTISNTNIKKKFTLKNFKERVNFYLGEKLQNKKVKNASKYKNVWTINDLTEGKNRFDKIYDKPLKELLIKTKNQDKKFIFRRADIMSIKEQNSLTLCKNRCDGNKSSVLLKCLNFKRHWELYYNPPKDIPFEKKSNKVFWRGTTTGCSTNWQSKEWQPRKVNRFKLIKNCFNKNEKFDIGFSRIHRDWLIKKYKKYVKGTCRPSDFLKHKYIISVEGNDKDSGINWKLNSNSLVLMPKPRVTSWLMETTLVPNYHYILLKDDFSDLEEKLNWCNTNQDKCKEIVKNANSFMKQFSNKENEQKIEEEVIKRYFKIVKF